jgi:AraC family transcriptional regulator
VSDQVVARTRLLQSPLGIAENLRCDGLRPRSSPAGFSPEFQVCLPYRGLFVWHVGGDEVIADANQVLFVTGGEPYRITEPLPHGYAELILTPRVELLAELMVTREPLLRSHPLFRRRSYRATPTLQALCSRFLHAAGQPHVDGVAAEELLVALLQSALGAKPAGHAPAVSTQRLIRRTKEFLQEHLAARLRLTDIARAVGASPAYLTDVFRRVEGVPLHAYVIQLRLGRSLVELPRTSDLTMLALDLGFSSHSHFTVAFRRAFGCTPSAYRQLTRAGRERRIA